jgi:Zn-dependent M28 family amino/carboxypeptidase
MKAIPALAAAAAVSVGAAWFRSMMDMPERSHSGPLPALTELEGLVAGRIEEHVRHLAVTIGERNMGRPDALDAAADYIAASFESDGLAVSRQEFTVGGGQAANIVAETGVAGSPAEIVVAGAHYDSVAGSPGANDNASGVAVLLEAARLLAGFEGGRRLRFIAFANEEPPYFQTEAMGSVVAARSSKRRGEKLAAVYSFETLGYYSDAPGSQSYPPLLGFFYPDRGNFVAFVGNRASAPLMRRSLSLFRGSAAFPSEGIAAPEAVPGVGWSDHWSYWQSGYQAVMVTDTAPYRYPWYHDRDDLPDRIDYDRTARVAVGLVRMLEAVAGGAEER